VHHFDQHHSHFQGHIFLDFAVFDGDHLNLVLWDRWFCQKNVSKTSENIGKTGSKHGKGTRRLNQSIQIRNEK